MQDALIDQPRLEELSRQAVLRAYGLPSNTGEATSGEVSPPPELLNLVRLAVQITGMASGAINIITADEQHTIAAHGIEPEVCSREDSMCSKVFQSGEITVVPDATRDHRFVNNPFVNGVKSSIRSYASVPLVSPAGSALGSLCVFTSDRQDLDPERREGLEILAAQVIEVLELQLRTRQLADALATVRRSNEDLAGFAARVSHDLKNPLTAILGYAELGEQDDSVSGPAAGYLRIIRGSAGRMLETVQEVLDFSRVGGSITRERVPLAAAVSAVRQDILPLVQDSGAGITTADAELVADPTLLRALLQNLIANAIKYSRPGTAPRIAVLAETGDAQVLTVVDNGKGIAPEDRTRVLEPLVRLSREGDPPGTGIGLATCARIASAHGGSISITDTPGGGTTVRVDLGPAGPLGASGPAGTAPRGRA
ncbi:GAF domain-containing protein [Arthrobacter frigidicola]|nr:GAF domain-containing protein [Arthrobacter frigidicola]